MLIIFFLCIFIADIKVGVPKFGVITMDISYGGAFYAILPASRLGLDLKTTKLQDLVSAATAVTGNIS